MLAPVAIVAARSFPPAALVASLVLAAAAVGSALYGGWRGWALAMAPGAVVVAVAAPDSLASFAVSAAAGPLVADALRRGRSMERATVVGALPAVALTIGAAASGFQPVPEELGPALTALFDEVGQQGELPAEQVAELRESSLAALRLVRRTWVASEAIWIWAAVALGTAWARRIVGRGWPGFGPFARFDLPDGVVWVLIAGLSAMLLGREGTLGVVGTNVVLVAGFAFALRGFAIESFWMDRARLGRVARIALFGLGAVLFLPVFLILAAGLGLFDTWFDFRGLRKSEPGSHPFSFMRRSSGDDANEKE